MVTRIDYLGPILILDMTEIILSLLPTSSHIGLFWYMQYALYVRTKALAL